MKITSKNGKIYEYDYKTTLIKKEQHEKIKKESQQTGEKMTDLLDKIILSYFK